jgi:hypothetical protein
MQYRANKYAQNAGAKARQNLANPLKNGGFAFWGRVNFLEMRRPRHFSRLLRMKKKVRKRKIRDTSSEVSRIFKVPQQV